jgi:dienelactone hydrolase
MNEPTEQANPGSRPVIYVCHPWSGDPARHTASILEWCRWLTSQGRVPLAPQLLLPQYISEEHQRELAMEHCLRLVDCCDELWVFHADKDWYDFAVSSGQQQEMDRARAVWGDGAARRIHHVWGVPQKALNIPAQVPDAQIYLRKGESIERYK